MTSTGGAGSVPDGLTSKIHLLADSGCRPLAPRAAAAQPGRVLGDKAYSSAAIRVDLRRHLVKATISELADQARNRLWRGSRGGRRPPSTAAYKQRNMVERAFCQLRQHRAVPTGTPSATSSCAGSSTSPRYGSGSVIPFHDLWETP